MTRQFWEKKGVEKILDFKKKEFECSFGPAPHDQAVLEKTEVWKNIRI